MKDINAPNVSVIIGTRNRAKLLHRAVISVLDQTYQDFECIIIDGGSTDNTPDVVKQFKDKRIIYIRQEMDEGRASSLNFAIKHSRGSLITFLDDDDEYLPSKLEKQVLLLKSLPKKVGLVYCWMDYYDDSTGELIREWHPTIKGDVYSEQIGKQSVGGFPTLLVRKEVLEKVGGLNERVNYPSDWEWVCRISRHFELDFVPEVLVKVYVNHEYQRMSNPKRDKKYYKDLAEFYLDFLKEHAFGFKVYPRKKFNHYLSLVGYYSHVGNFNEFVYYSLLTIKTKPFNIKGYKRFAGGLIKFILGNKSYNDLKSVVTRFH